MEQYIDKSTLIAEIERRFLEYNTDDVEMDKVAQGVLASLKYFIDTLEVKDPYEQCVQYDSIKAGIQAHAETYSFNIESLLFNQLTKEQQVLWRKEIEQACISGGEAGYELARDMRYKENFEGKEVDLEKELDYDDYMSFFEEHPDYSNGDWGFDECWVFAKHFFELGLKVQKGEEV